MLMYRPLLEKLSVGRFRIGSQHKPNHNLNQRPTADSRQPSSDPQNADIALRINTSNGFEQLTDDEEGNPQDSRPYARPYSVWR